MTCPCKFCHLAIFETSKLDISTSLYEILTFIFQFVQLIKGSSPVEIRTAPVVQVAVDLAVSLDDFFDPNNLISCLAFVLKVDPSTIRVVK